MDKSGSASTDTIDLNLLVCICFPGNKCRKDALTFFFLNPAVCNIVILISYTKTMKQSTSCLSDFTHVTPKLSDSAA